MRFCVDGFNTFFLKKLSKILKISLKILEGREKSIYQKAFTEKKNAFRSESNNNNNIGTGTRKSFFQSRVQKFRPAHTHVRYVVI